MTSYTKAAASFFRFQIFNAGQTKLNTFTNVEHSFSNLIFALTWHSIARRRHTKNVHARGIFEDQFLIFE